MQNIEINILEHENRRRKIKRISYGRKNIRIWNDCLLNKQNEQHKNYKWFCQQKQLKCELWPADAEKK